MTCFYRISNLENAFADCFQQPHDFFKVKLLVTFHYCVVTTTRNHWLYQFHDETKVESRTLVMSGIPSSMSTTITIAASFSRPCFPLANDGRRPSTAVAIPSTLANCKRGRNDVKSIVGSRTGSENRPKMQTWAKQGNEMIAWEVKVVAKIHEIKRILATGTANAPL